MLRKTYIRFIENKDGKYGTPTLQYGCEQGLAQSLEW